MRKINNQENLAKINAGEVTCEETTGALYGAGVVMMMIPGLQVFGFGISAMALAAGYNC